MKKNILILFMLLLTSGVIHAQAIFVASFACKLLTHDAKFCYVVGLSGKLDIPEKDPLWTAHQKDVFDAQLEKKGIAPVKFWSAFDKKLKSKSCQEDLGFTYDPKVPAWSQNIGKEADKPEINKPSTAVPNKPSNPPAANPSPPKQQSSTPNSEKGREGPHPHEPREAPSREKPTREAPAREKPAKEAPIHEQAIKGENHPR